MPPRLPRVITKKRNALAHERERHSLETDRAPLELDRPDAALRAWNSFTQRAANSYRVLTCSLRPSGSPDESTARGTEPFGSNQDAEAACHCASTQ